MTQTACRQLVIAQLCSKLNQLIAITRSRRKWRRGVWPTDNLTNQRPSTPQTSVFAPKKLAKWRHCKLKGDEMLTDLIVSYCSHLCCGFALLLCWFCCDFLLIWPDLLLSYLWLCLLLWSTLTSEDEACFDQRTLLFAQNQNVSALKGNFLYLLNLNMKLQPATLSKGLWNVSSAPIWS